MFFSQCINGKRGKKGVRRVNLDVGQFKPRILVFV